MQLNLLKDGRIWVTWAGLGWINFTCWKASGNNFLSERYTLSFVIRQNQVTFPSKHHTANETDAFGFRLKEPIQCPLPGKCASLGRSQGRLSLRVCGFHAGAEGASQKFGKNRSQARLGQRG